MGNKMLEYEKQWKADMEETDRLFEKNMNRLNKELRNHILFSLFILTTIVVVGLIVGHIG